MAAEKQVDPMILNTVSQVNYHRRRMVVDRVEDLIGKLEGKTIGLLGLAFKPNTDDMRAAPSIDIARMLMTAGARVRAYDPVAIENARSILPEVTMFDDPYELAKDTDALILITEWNEFKQLDLVRIRASMKTPVLFDGRNVYDPAEVRSLGFIYRGIGRGFDGKENASHPKTTHM
jgi:UDPglucose 6-dehydrogenase